MNPFFMPGTHQYVPAGIPAYAGTVTSLPLPFTISHRFIMWSPTLGGTYGRLVGWSTGGQPWYSDDLGANWTQSNIPPAVKTFYMKGAWVNDRFIVNNYGGNAQSTDPTLYSLDGITWSSVALPAAGYWSTPMYGNGIYLITSWATGVTTYFTSTDALTWTSRTSNIASHQLHQVFWNGTTYCSTGVNATQTITATSPDCITWTAGQTLSNSLFKGQSMAYISPPGTYLIENIDTVGATSNTQAWSTSNGTTWNGRNTGATSIANRRVVAGNARYVVYGTNSTETQVSTNGTTTWATGPVLPVNAGDGAVYAYGKFFIPAVPGTAISVIS